MKPSDFWLFVIFVSFVSFKIYEYKYYKDEKFLSVKSKVVDYINNCNELNFYIEELKEAYLRFQKIDFGVSSYTDNSKWNFKRPKLNSLKYQQNVYNCSRSVCSNARNQPFKYLCKYFNISENENSINEFGKILNNFESVEEGKNLLRKEKKRILDSIKEEIPILIKILSSKKLERELGFEEVDFSSIYFPRYKFLYVSPGGNSSLQCEIILNIENLNKFIKYLSDIVDYRNSAKGQRSLMTSSLRRKILERDNYTCKICGNSIFNEPNLLMEVDHIRPISKGGMTKEDNLQTLCWKCNRSKGSK